MTVLRRLVYALASFWSWLQLSATCLHGRTDGYCPDCWMDAQW